jgi:hypothetical protein
MAGPEFFQTVMGRRFFERDIPRLIEVVGRVADGLEKQPDPLHGSAGPEDVPAIEALLAAWEHLKKMLMLNSESFPNPLRHDTAVTLHVVTEALEQLGWEGPEEEDQTSLHFPDTKS